MSALNFMTSIYWGELRHCREYRHHTCEYGKAYGCISAFSVLIFLNQIMICAAVILWKNDLIADDGDGAEGYDDRLDHSSTRQHQVGGAHDHLMATGSIVQTSTDI